MTRTPQIPHAIAHVAHCTAFGERITATATPNPFWPFPQYAQMETVVAEQVQAVLVGKASPADAMKAAGKSVQALTA